MIYESTIIHKILVVIKIQIDGRTVTENMSKADIIAFWITKDGVNPTISYLQHLN